MKSIVELDGLPALAPNCGCGWMKNLWVLERIEVVDLEGEAALMRIAERPSK